MNYEGLLLRALVASNQLSSYLWKRGSAKVAGPSSYDGLTIPRGPITSAGSVRADAPGGRYTRHTKCPRYSASIAARTSLGGRSSRPSTASGGIAVGVAPGWLVTRRNREMVRRYALSASWSSYNALTRALLRLPRVRPVGRGNA